MLDLDKLGIDPGQFELTPPAFDYDQYLYEAITFLNQRGVSILDVTVEVRQKALTLEGQFTRAGNAREKDHFTSLVDKWRDLFLGMEDY